MKPNRAAWIFLLMLAACGGAEKPPYPGIKIGKPYQVYGRTYKPHYDPTYDETGMASWYGPGFHGGHTATGETFDQEAMTAAHRTLPLPSIVRVTNLDNGMSAILRINDRGPFSHDRILDLSHAAAVRLGVYRMGTARVRVQFLDSETRDYVRNVLGSRQYYAAAPVSPVLMSPIPLSPAPIPGAGAPLEPETIFLTPPVQGAPPVPGGTPDVFSVVDAQAVSPPVAETPEAQPFTPPVYARPETVPPQTVAIPPQESTAPFVAPVELPLSSQAPSGGFFVQAGTFSQQQNALSLIDRIGSEGNPQVKPINVKGRDLYRVLIGPYSEREDAKKLLSKLAAAGISDARIIQSQE